MSKRAEQAALKAYPEMDLYRAANPHKTQLRKERRRCYKQGYEQAEKDTFERIVEYLGNRDLEHTILGFDKYGYAYIDFESLEMLIRKAMEE